ncbi:hypothetical protein SAMN05216551_115131 [Chitinasiproducens palmae]|uniref:Uncharacterized protein n=1 Tax=Chitinasiproducens palmae TaxID=1770053 RepID=A0A1H2PVC9_9BURK|nr:hypothetical protein SAMN05216551_115131 [Chitinasiproducens palmae]
MKRRMRAFALIWPLALAACGSVQPAAPQLPTPVAVPCPTLPPPAPWAMEAPPAPSLTQRLRQLWQESPLTAIAP